jgi:CHASE3 domain sensor protein
MIEKIHHFRIKIIFLFAKTFATLSDKESSQRAYLFTNDFVFLTPYFAAGIIINSALNTIDSLIKENPSQQNLIVLRTTIVERMNMMEHNVALFQTQKVSIPGRLKGKAIMDTVSAQFNKMQNEEDKLISI